MPVGDRWKRTLVLETTGKFKMREENLGHIQAGAKKVVMGAPGKDPDATIVMGVNDGIYDAAEHLVVSNALLHHQLPGPGGQGAQ